MKIDLMIGLLMMLVSLSAFTPQSYLKQFIKGWRDIHTFIYWCYRLVMLFIAVVGLLFVVSSFTSA